MRNAKIKLNCNDGAERIVDCKELRLNDGGKFASNLVAHRPLGSFTKRSRWVLTHRNSGCLVGIECKNLDQVERVLNRLLSNFDWNFGQLSNLREDSRKKLQVLVLDVRKKINEENNPRPKIVAERRAS